jgi:hypothetical protein
MDVEVVEEWERPRNCLRKFLDVGPIIATETETPDLLGIGTE